MQTVGQIAEFIAPYIGAVYPNDTQRIFEILSLTQRKIWESGKFLNSTKWFYVNVNSNNEIITPHGYNILLACNVNFKPLRINDNYFLFHKNGAGDSILTDKYNQDIMFLGSSPVIRQPNERFCNPCLVDDECKKYILAVESSCCIKINGRFPKTRVSAIGGNGKQIFTYFKQDTGDVPCICGTNEELPSEIETIEGIEFPICGKKVVAECIEISEIYNIIKEPTLSNVKYYAINKNTRNGFLLAELGPYDIMSEYNRWKVLGSCVKLGCILGLFKKSKPAEIVDPNQIFITDNKNAILNLAQSVYEANEKKNFAAADQFERRGLLSLSNEIREGKPHNNQIQIDSMKDHTKLPVF